MNQSENRRVTTGMRSQGRDDLVKVPTPGASSSTMLVGQRGLRPGWKHIQVLARTAPRSWKPPPFPARVIPTSGGLLHFICRAREPKCQKIKFDHPQVHPVLRVKKAGRTSGCWICLQPFVYNQSLHWPDLIFFFFYFLIFIRFYLFVWLHWVLVAACRISSCGMWDLGPQPGIKPRSPALGVQSLSHWTAREVPDLTIFQTFPESLCGCPTDGITWAQHPIVQTPGFQLCPVPVS